MTPIIQRVRIVQALALGNKPSDRLLVRSLKYVRSMCNSDLRAPIKMTRVLAVHDANSNEG